MGGGVNEGETEAKTTREGENKTIFYKISESHGLLIFLNGFTAKLTVRPGEREAAA